MGWRVDNEQRQTRRVSVELPLRFRVQSMGTADAPQFVHASTTNISSLGLGFVASLNMPLHTAVSLILELPGIEQSIAAEGVVVRIVADRPEIVGIEYGLRFTKVEPKEALDRYVRSVDITPLLKLMVKHDASDLHLSVSAPPYLRVGRDLMAAGEKIFAPEAVEALINGIMGVQYRRKLRRFRDVSFPYTLPGVGRWHVNVFYQRGFVEATFHTIHGEVPSLDQLGLPESLRDLVLERSGLVLVTGPEKSGKSTTLAALVNTINKAARRNILTLENPIQYAFENDRSVVRQREVGIDVRSYGEGLRSAMLQDADVIVVGEIADAETTELALRAADAGRLVLAAMSASDAVHALDRIAALRPPDERLGTLHILASALTAVVSQRLLPQRDGRGLALAAEIMIPNESVRNVLRYDKLDQMPNILRATPGFQSLDMSLRSLVLRQIIDVEVASTYSSDAERLRKSLVEHRV